MAFKRNTLLLVFRLVIIIAVMMCFPVTTYFIRPQQLVFTFLVITLVLVFLVTELVFFLNRTNRELNGFLQHIRNRDFSIRFNEKNTRGARRNLYHTFNEVLQTYRNIRIEREVHFRFLEHILELIEVGIMVLDQHGKVVMMNTAAGSLTGLTSPGTWEQIKKRNPGFAASVDKTNHSGRVLFESCSAGMNTRLAIQVNHTTMLKEPYTLLTFQDISSEVADKETGAWVRLMRTLNHEIKNSVTPVSSLADTIMMILQNNDGSPKTIEEIDPENLSDLITSVKTLQQRCSSLYKFIEEYHKLTRVPAPAPEDITAGTLLEETAAVFSSDLKKSGIRLAIQEAENDLIIRADRGLIQQALINLIKNSMEALTDHPGPLITLGCSRSEGGVTLSVQDNGEGIGEDILEDIFVPFFSTKPEGSGIGLSLARQVMRLHGGNIHINSKKGEGTIVFLDFYD